LANNEISKNEIDFVVKNIGFVNGDNRGGIERTLHRISVIRNRSSNVIGVTCRVGRSVYGAADVISDIISLGKSVLLVGSPGSGKTTILREVSRILSEGNRVVIVDTSNEIAGDGDIPHPAIGRARRLQVAKPELQHEVMVEAVENHNPQVIVIDEIGRPLEVAAARTIAERGVQLIGTAHGRTLENLVVNPVLCDLVGGIESVTLGDDEARRRGTQKTVLERRAEPTFDVLIEIHDRENLVVYHDVSKAIDRHLKGLPLHGEPRTRGNTPIEKAVSVSMAEIPGKNHRRPTLNSFLQAEEVFGAVLPHRLYAFRVSHEKVLEASRALGFPVEMVEFPSDADFVLTLRSVFRSKPKQILEAERCSIPIYTIQSNTAHHVMTALSDVMNHDLVLSQSSR
jgi:stage III sporulation protein AA